MKRQARGALAPLALLVAALLVAGVRGDAYQLDSDTACNTCAGAGNVVCRTGFYDRYAYCCSEAEVGTRSCGGRDVFCSTQALNPVMSIFACPYSYNYCGASSSELKMHPTKRNSLKFEISNRRYVDGETCYYQIYVPTSDLDMRNMRYFWDIEITTMTNVAI